MKTLLFEEHKKQETTIKQPDKHKNTKTPPKKKREGLPPNCGQVGGGWARMRVSLWDKTDKTAEGGARTGHDASA